MGRYSRSRSPPPSRRRPYEDPRERSSRRHSSPAPTGLLVRNIPLDARPEELRVPFERFGPVNDVYLPRNYHTGEPRGFGFVKFRNPEDAAEAKYQLNHAVISGREISIVFAEENRKTPQEMRSTSRVSSRYGGGHRGRSPPRSSRHIYRSYSRSPSPRHDYRYQEDRNRYKGSRSRSISRSPTPKREKYRRRSQSPREADQSPEKRSRNSDKKPTRIRDDMRSPSPVGGSRSPSPRGNGRRSEKVQNGSDHRSSSPHHAAPVHASLHAESSSFPAHEATANESRA